MLRGRYVSTMLSSCATYLNSSMLLGARLSTAEMRTFTSPATAESGQTQDVANGAHRLPKILEKSAREDLRCVQTWSRWKKHATNIS